jgi:hypothetical protein
MLALGATHLSITTPDNLNSQALTHRVEAVKLLNKALCRPAVTKEEADARFATFMILTFQSSCMADGVVDFLTMLRGCILQGDVVSVERSAFACFLKNRHLETMEARFSDARLEALDTKTLGEAVGSIVALEELCQTDQEKLWHKLLTELVANAYTSPKAGMLFPFRYKSNPPHDWLWVLYAHTLQPAYNID